MKRILPGLLSMIFLLSLLVSMPLAAQESTPKDEQPQAATKKKLPPPWRMAKGIDITKVPRINEKEPEFAIVRMDDAEYKKFQQNPKDWINDHHIFKAKVKRMKPLAETKPEKDPPPEETYWYVIITHWPGSTATATSCPATEPS